MSGSVEQSCETLNTRHDAVASRSGFWAANAKLRKKFALYGMVGVVATVADWFVFYVMNIVYALHYEIAIVTSFLVGSCINYTLNRCITFRSRKALSASLAYFSAISAFSLAVSALFMFLQISVLDMGQLIVLGVSGKFIARILTTVIMYIVNFFMHNAFTFSDKSFKEHWDKITRR